MLVNDASDLSENALSCIVRSARELEALLVASLSRTRHLSYRRFGTINQIDRFGVLTSTGRPEISRATYKGHGNCNFPLRSTSLIGDKAPISAISKRGAADSPQFLADLAHPVALMADILHAFRLQLLEALQQLQILFVNVLK